MLGVFTPLHDKRLEMKANKILDTFTTSGTCMAQYCVPFRNYRNKPKKTHSIVILVRMTLSAKIELIQYFV